MSSPEPASRLPFVSSRLPMGDNVGEVVRIDEGRGSEGREHGECGQYDLALLVSRQAKASEPEDRGL